MSHVAGKSPDFPPNLSFSGRGQPLSKVTCLVIWLKFPLALPRTCANNIGSGETVRMSGSPEPLLFAYGILGLFPWHGSYYDTRGTFFDRKILLNLETRVCKTLCSPFICMTQSHKWGVTG